VEALPVAAQIKPRAATPDVDETANIRGGGNGPLPLLLLLLLNKVNP
jgi:hypothetical protein